MALLGGASVAEAAAVAGVSERTAYRWLRSEDIREGLRICQADVLDGAKRLALSGVVEALATLREVMGSASMSGAAKVGAARAWLDFSGRFLELHAPAKIAPHEGAAWNVRIVGPLGEAMKDDPPGPDVCERCGKPIERIVVRWPDESHRSHLVT